MLDVDPFTGEPWPPEDVAAKRREVARDSLRRLSHLRRKLLEWREVEAYNRGPGGDPERAGYAGRVVAVLRTRVEDCEALLRSGPLDAY